MVSDMFDQTKTDGKFRQKSRLIISFYVRHKMESDMFDVLAFMYGAMNLKEISNTVCHPSVLNRNYRILMFRKPAFNKKIKANYIIFL
jgi:hypothetical protein